MGALSAGNDDDTADFIQDGIVYRLTWALEALRVWGLETGVEAADEVHGIAALCCESGTLSLPAALLVRSGLESRTAALEAVERGGADFVDVSGMSAWIRSKSIRGAGKQADWPSSESHEAWIRFVSGARRQRHRKWVSRESSIVVDWGGATPPVPVEGALRVARDHAGTWRVFTPDFQPVAALVGPYAEPTVGVVRVRRDAGPNRIRVEVYGPT